MEIPGLMQGGKRAFVLNVVNDPRPMTEARAQAFAAYYTTGELPSGPGKEFFKKLYHEVLKAVLVSVQPVDSQDKLAPWARKAGCVYKKDKRTGMYWDCACTCFDFKHSNNTCVHVLTVAAHLGFLNLEVLQGTCVPRRMKGRPRVGTFLEKSNGEPMSRDVGKWLDFLIKEKPLRLQWRFVMVRLQEGDVPRKGYIDTCSIIDPDYSNRDKRTYIIKVPDHPHDVRLSPKQLAEALVLASEYQIGAEYYTPPDPRIGPSPDSPN